MIFFIVAVDEKWGIAKEHRIPWHFKKDFAFFKKTTTGTHCLMGYNTFKEIANMRGYPEKTDSVLPDRTCHVLTSKDIPESEWVKSHKKMPTGYDITSKLGGIQLAYIGGPAVYTHAMESYDASIKDDIRADYGYITRIKGDYECDTFFNHDLLERNFELEDIVQEDENMRIELWLRK